MLYVDRRGFMRISLGGFATMVMAGAVPMLGSSEALAVAGVDDAVIGGLVLVMMTLGGYAVAEAVSDATLQAMGYSFRDFAADADNQAAAVTRAIADANNLGVEVNRANAESAAAVIGAGTDAFADWVTDAAETGRISIDGWLGGAGAQQAALWGLLAEFVSQNLDSVYLTPASGAVFANGGNEISRVGLGVKSLPHADIMALFDGQNIGYTPTWCMTRTRPGSYGPVIWTGSGALPYMDYGINESGFYSMYTSSAQQWSRPRSGAAFTSVNRNGWWSWSATDGLPIFSDNCITGGMLPGVDKAADAPETYGAGYDKTPIGADATYGQDGAVVSPGTIALPIQLPGVDVPYAQGLYGATAGVVPGIVSFPLSGETGVVVGTPEGVVTMPISQAIAADTSISASAIPSDPVVPEGTPDVGPWTPAYNLPFMDVWPFNMIYSFVQSLSGLGAQ